MPTAGNPLTDDVPLLTYAGRILRALGTDPVGLSRSELAAGLGIAPRDVARIVDALEAEGLITSAGPGGRLGLGSEFYRLARAQHRHIRYELRPFLVELSAAVNETVGLSVPDGDHVSLIDEVSATRDLTVGSTVGMNPPAHSTAGGKALLANYPDEALRRLLPARLELEAPNTITDREALLDEIRVVRRDGYAIARDEQTLGISAVGTTLRDASGPVAAVSILVPTSRFPGDRRQLASVLLGAAATMNEALGTMWPKPGALSDLRPRAGRPLA